MWTVKVLGKKEEKFSDLVLGGTFQKKYKITKQKRLINSAILEWRTSLY